MPISFSCESCKKKIKAPDSTGGKWGKCPHCQHRCYIPLPKSDDEPELALAPVDEGHESQVEQMMKETHSLTQFILHENEPVAAGPNEKAGARTADEKEVVKQCIIYLRRMADGDLMPAEKTLGTLKKNKKAALRILAAMARSEQPEPELSDLPPRIIQGLVRDASAKLSS